MKNILDSVNKKIDSCSCHGVTPSEYDVLRAMLSSATSTDTNHKTEFPDFICESGFIEHFRVTEGKSNRKGYDNMKKASKMIANGEKYAENHYKSLPKKPTDVIMNKYSEYSISNNGSLKNLHKSFIEKWESHISSLHKYNGKKHISVFLVSSDDLIEVCCLENGKTSGYFLSYDAELLDYLYQYHADVDYVIYYNERKEEIEVIKLSYIPCLKKFLSKHHYQFASCYAIIGYDTYCVSVPIQ